ncbi:MAG: MarR family transcriptional regulator [Clostridia bacterium]|nr:MarR family transcriptional regulator [Clostridia bacterium]
MQDIQNQKINEFFVSAFNNLLILEEAYLRKHCAADLSVREVHVLAAVNKLSGEQKNTMANIAKFLCVSPGSLTTAVNTLVSKGYLERSYTPRDRRVVFIHLSASGEEACVKHAEYHRQLVNAAAEKLSDKEVEILVGALDKVCAFTVEKAEKAE